MTSHVKIHGIIPRIQYTANGTLTTFTFPFAIFSTSDIEVYLNDTKQSDTAYTVSGVRNSEGGSVTFISAPASGSVVTIVRNLSIERTSDFQEGGALRADTLNDEFDYQIACQQQIADNLNRSMTLPPYAVNSDVDLTLPTPMAGKAIIWNGDGTSLENSTIEVNALESTLKGYKTAAEAAVTAATNQAGIASDKADLATQKAQLASDKADIATAKAAEASSAAGDKAGVDLDNISATGKRNIVAQVVADWDSSVSLSTTVGSTYTCPKDGFLFLSNYNGVLSLKTSKNTNILYIQYGNNYFTSSCEYFVGAGEILTVDASTGTCKLYFLPLKGA